MAATTNYGWVKPTVGGSAGTWGTELNTALDDIDVDLKAAENAALPKAGGTMTGRLDAKTATASYVAKGSVSGAQTLDCTAGHWFSLTATGNVTFTFGSPPAGAFGFLLELEAAGHTMTWPASVDWPAGVAPTPTSGGKDLFAFMTRDSGTTWHGVRLSADSK